MRDALAAGVSSDETPLAEGGAGALAYGQAVGVYLAFLVDKLTDYHSSICSWNAPRDGIRNTFGRQAIPMVWDYVEGNPLRACLETHLSIMKRFNSMLAMAI